MPLTKSPWGNLKALEIYKLIQDERISEYEFGEWLVEKLVEAHKEGYSRGLKDNHN
jgi:hypothetical protein